jgi:hypothetical protein
MLSFLRPLTRQSKAPASRRPDLECLEVRLTPSSASTISSNFNGTPIAAGDTLWFSSVAKVNGLGSTPVTLHVTNGEIDFTAGGVPYAVKVPDAAITFDPKATAATTTTTFDAASNTWDTTVPPQFSGNVFLAGAALPVSVNLPGGIQPVSWHATFSATVTGLNVNWQWAASVYPPSVASVFNSGLGALGVKPVDDNHLGQYQNSDQAGTPENVVALKPNMPGGARGGGGSNWTGSLSATASLHPDLYQAPQQQDTSSLAGTVFIAGTTQGVSGVIITLTDSQGQPVPGQPPVTTSPSGDYSFSDLPAGTYTITETTPFGYTADFTSIANIVLGSGQKDTGLDFNLHFAS